MPAVQSWAIEPLWEQFAALIPPVIDTHPLGCPPPRIPDRIVFDNLVQVLVLGAAVAAVFVVVSYLWANSGGPSFSFQMLPILLPFVVLIGVWRRGHILPRRSVAVDQHA